MNAIAIDKSIDGDRYDRCISGSRRREPETREQIILRNRYDRCISASKRVRWDIDKDVIRGRRFDRVQKYLPDGLSLVQEFATLSEDEKRFVSQIQGSPTRNVRAGRAIHQRKVLEIGHDYRSATRLRWKRWCGSAMRN